MRFCLSYEDSLNVFNKSSKCCDVFLVCLKKNFYVTVKPGLYLLAHKCVNEFFKETNTTAVCFMFHHNLFPIVLLCYLIERR